MNELRRILGAVILTLAAGVGMCFLALGWLGKKVWGGEP